jgi:hypothetical protein
MTILPKIRRGAAPAVRNATLRKPIRAVMVLLATLAAVFAAPLPASAAANHLCETNGNFCVGAPSLATFAPVVETLSGRNITLIFLGNDAQGIPQFEIQLDAAPSECVAGADNGIDVVLHHCNGGLGVVWKRHFSQNGHLQWNSREFPTKWLAGHNDGTQYQLKPLGLSGWFYNFDLV